VRRAGELFVEVGPATAARASGRSSERQRGPHLGDGDIAIRFGLAVVRQCDRFGVGWPRRSAAAEARVADRLDDPAAAGQPMAARQRHGAVVAGEVLGVLVEGVVSAGVAVGVGANRQPPLALFTPRMSWLIVTALAALATPRTL
jgi:hypothetical protein